MSNRIKLRCLLACILTVALPLAAQDKSNASNGNDIETLKKMLADQQRQIDELRRQLSASKTDDANQKKADVAPAYTTTGQVASTTPIVPAAPAVTPGPVFPPAKPSSSSAAAPDPQGEPASPLQFHLGDAYFTPVGFMDMTMVARSTNAGSSIGTNFGSIPYGNTQAGSLTEDRLSIQNSRIGMRVDALVKGWNVLGYWESDFLGQTGNPPNGGIAVTSNSYPFRLRLYWVDLKKNKFEFLAGQTWSLITPNRKGLSPLPGDVFYSQDFDTNYQLGLVWGRIPSYRFVLHPNNTVAVGLELTNSEPYVGGGNGGSGIVAPACCSGFLGSQINNGSSVTSAAGLAPDIIAKVAFDPNSRFHLEIGGVEIANKIADPAATPAYKTFSKVGGGGEINLNAAIVKNVRLISNNFWGDGAGRYIFGQAPGFIIRGDGSLSNVHAGSLIDGFEITAGKTLFYTYYGGVYIQKNLALDANGKTLIGYGPISSDGQNRFEQEFSVGTNTTLMKDSKWGALNIVTQFSWEQRNPWLVATGAPGNAHAFMGWFDFRYTLPGSAPTLGK